ncbi:hypothetical protein SteCoe_24461 [Stentor coeruleus]|uniref:Uncharacterized protein n=1 Tax=Stentor coeruleus TaxID=5963 RepID=A0A1R2BHT7_9CILI|nr:hypothetical protein SteCoe_24461 [Stentor coeruleus]
MGCCNFTSLEQEVLNEAKLEMPPNSPDLSFADLDIGSNGENEHCKDLASTEELLFLSGNRNRSTSYNSLRYSNQIEKAFLMTTPLRSAIEVSRSCNLKSNDTFLESTSSLSFLRNYH